MYDENPNLLPGCSEPGCDAGYYDTFKCIYCGARYCYIHIKRHERDEQWTTEEQEQG